MNKTDALRLLVAAEDDPVLAAWAAVLHEHQMPYGCDVSPYDHFDAFQDLFSHGLVPSSIYDQVDIKRVFFSGRRMPSGDVQLVLDSMRLGRPPQENLMSNAKKPFNAFKTDTSLATTGEKEGGMQHHVKPVLTTPKTGFPDCGELAAFNPDRETLPASKGMEPTQMFSHDRPAAGLACADVDARTYREGTELNCELRCCGHVLRLVEEDGDIIPAEEATPEGQYALIEYMFHAECGNCGALYHTSIGKPIPRDSY